MATWKVRTAGWDGATQLATDAEPILLTLPDKTLRNGLLVLANQLKENNEPYKKIYIKKDVHPSVRRQWRRLGEAERRNRTEQRMEDV